MRAPLRPRFQRPRTQLVHLLLDVQPLARVLGYWILSWILSACLSVHAAKKCSALAGFLQYSEDECDIESKVVKLWTMIKDEVLRSGTYRLVIEDTRLYSLDGRNAYTRCVIIVINCFPKAPGKKLLRLNVSYFDRC